MYATLLKRLCNLIAPLVLILVANMRKTNLFGYFSEIQDILFFLNNSSIRKLLFTFIQFYSNLIYLI